MVYQQDLYGLLIKTAADSIIKLAFDPHYVGGQVGVMAVLHTWGSNLSYHLHVHCLVTGGGLSSDVDYFVRFYLLLIFLLSIFNPHLPNKARIFTTGLIAWPGVTLITDKDFSGPVLI